MVKSAVEDQLQRLFDTLLDSLRSQALSGLESLTTFVTTASEALQVMPQTIQEIGDANAKYALFYMFVLEVYVFGFQCTWKNKALIIHKTSSALYCLAYTADDDN